MARHPIGDKPLSESMLTWFTNTYAAPGGDGLRKPKNVYPISIISHHLDGAGSWDLFILHIQYHGCWWPGDANRQGISSHDIDLILLEFPNLATRMINILRNA